MSRSGGCYCGALRYESDGAPLLQAQCHCRECQQFSGGAVNYFMLVPAEGFRYVKGAPKSFTRSDIDNPVTREFCSECGTHILTRRPGLDAIVLKIGTLDDPEVFTGPQMAIFTIEKRSFHDVPDGLPTFERLPPGA